MRLLAISYFVPPMQFPQAIQIGRLLAGLHDDRLGLVSGTTQGDDATAAQLRSHCDFWAQVPHRQPLSGIAQQLALRLVPFYGRSPDGFKSWIRQAENETLAALQRSGFSPDAMVSFGEPMSDHILALRLKQKLGLPWIAHFSDPWSDNAFRRHEVLSNIINRRFEAQVMAGADGLIFTSPETVELVMRKYPQSWRGKTAVLPHSFDAALYASMSMPPQGQISLRYIGNFYGHRSPLPLFQALRLILDRAPDQLTDVVVDLIGGIPQRMLRNPVYRSLPEGLVRLSGTVGYDQSLTLMREASLLLVIDGPDDFSVFLPSKLIDYIGAGTPVFGIVPPGASDRVIRSMGGEVAPPTAVEAIAEGLLRQINRVRSDRQPGRPWGDMAVRGQYQLPNIVASFRQIVSKVIAGKKLDADAANG